MKDVASYLKEMMTDELVSKFSCPGGQMSQRFGDTKLSSVLYHAAQKCSQFRGPADKAQFKTEMLEVLRATKQRYRKQMKRSLTTESKKTDTEDSILYLYLYLYLFMKSS